MASVTMNFSRQSDNRTLTILFYAFILSLFMEGVFRKWIMPGGSAMVFFAIKYVILLLMAFFVAVRKTHDRSIPVPMKTAMGIYAFLVIVSACGFTLFYNGLPVTFIAIIQYVGPLIIVYAMPSVFNTDRSLDKGLAVFALIAFCCLILAVVQYLSPKDAIINRYGADMAHVAMVGKSVRVTSVFSYITPIGDFIIVIVAFCLCALFYKRCHYGTFRQLSLYGLLVLAIVVSFMTGSRSVVGITGAFLLICIAYNTSRGNMRQLILFLMLIAAFVWYYNDYGMASVDNFILRSSKASDSFGGRINKMLAYSHMMDYGGLIGNGAGFTSNALQGLLSYRSPIYFEEELGRLILEFGAIGTLIITGVRIVIFVQMVRIFKTIKGNWYKNLSAACVLGILPSTIYLQLCLFDWFSYMCYWVLVGLNVSLKNLELRACLNLNRC